MTSFFWENKVCSSGWSCRWRGLTQTLPLAELGFIIQPERQAAVGRACGLSSRKQPILGKSCCPTFLRAGEKSSALCRGTFSLGRVNDTPTPRSSLSNISGPPQPKLERGLQDGRLELQTGMNQKPGCQSSRPAVTCWPCNLDKSLLLLGPHFLLRQIKEMNYIRGWTIVSSQGAIANR